MRRVNAFFFLLIMGHTFAQDRNSMRVEHCPASKAASVSVQIFSAGDRTDAGHVMDTSGLLNPGQAIDLACNMVITRRDYCQASILATNEDNQRTASSRLRFDDGATYRVCADPSKGKINVTKTSCDCTF